jgi:hypothetical protein
MNRHVIALLLAVVAMGAAVGSANAASVPGLPEGGATVTEMDKRGRPLGPPVPVIGHLVGASEVAVAAAPVGAAGRVRALQATSGCRTVDAWRNSYTLLGFISYRYHQIKYWCWSGNRVTTVNVTHRITDADGSIRDRGLISSASWYYNWCCGLGTSGHYSMRQNRVDNCPLHLPCIRTEYPSVSIWSHSDGTFTYSTSL